MNAWWVVSTGVGWGRVYKAMLEKKGEGGVYKGTHGFRARFGDSQGAVKDGLGRKKGRGGVGALAGLKANLAFVCANKLPAPSSVK